jgi:hypothetical protein
MMKYRSRLAVIHAVLVVAAALLAQACNSSSMAGPSPVILPDYAAVRVGESKVLSVQYGTVLGFQLAANNQDGVECVAAAQTLSEPNSIRILGLHPCPGYVYLTVSIGEHRSPLAAVLNSQ